MLDSLLNPLIIYAVTDLPQQIIPLCFGVCTH